MFIAGPVYSIIQFKLILCCIIYIYIYCSLPKIKNGDFFYSYLIFFVFIKHYLVCVCMCWPKGFKNNHDKIYKS